MEDQWYRRERRLQKALERLGTNTPRCVHCGEDDPRVLERHHIAGRKHDEAVCIVCSNCHRKLSDVQKDHPQSIARPPQHDSATQVAHFLLGLADLFELLIAKFREFAHRLLVAASDGTPSTGGRDA